MTSVEALQRNVATLIVVGVTIAILAYLWRNVYDHTPEPPQTRWTIPSLDERGAMVRFDADPPGDNAPVLTIYPELLPQDALICLGTLGCRLVRDFTK